LEPGSADNRTGSATAKPASIPSIPAAEKPQPGSRFLCRPSGRRARPVVESTPASTELHRHSMVCQSASMAPKRHSKLPQTNSVALQPNSRLCQTDSVDTRQRSVKSKPASELARLQPFTSILGFRPPGSAGAFIRELAWPRRVANAGRLGLRRLDAAFAPVSLRPSPHQDASLPAQSGGCVPLRNRTPRRCRVPLRQPSGSAGFPTCQAQCIAFPARHEWESRSEESLGTSSPHPSLPAALGSERAAARLSQLSTDD
jgi:hypothetical protein